MSAFDLPVYVFGKNDPITDSDLCKLANAAYRQGVEYANLERIEEEHTFGMFEWNGTKYRVQLAEDEDENENIIQFLTIHKLRQYSVEVRRTITVTALTEAWGTDALDAEELVIATEDTRKPILGVTPISDDEWFAAAGSVVGGMARKREGQIEVSAELLFPNQIKSAELVTIAQSGN